VSPPRLLADEMVGRLARYLRMFGCDTLYAKDWTDEEIARVARTEDRVVVTRDRELSRRAVKAVLLTSPRIEDQVRQVLAAFPDLSWEVRLERCTVCNGQLQPYQPTGEGLGEEGVPWDRVAGGLPLYRCSACAHVYWEGTHTAGLRDRLQHWVAEDAT
jgi:uncharacterized protein